MPQWISDGHGEKASKSETVGYKRHEEEFTVTHSHLDLQNMDTNKQHSTTSIYTSAHLNRYATNSPYTSLTSTRFSN